MKTNIYTNRYETVLPDSLRRRYRVPRQKCDQSFANAETSGQPIAATVSHVKQPTYANGAPSTSPPQNKDNEAIPALMPASILKEGNSNPKLAKNAEHQLPGCITTITANPQESAGYAKFATANITTENPIRRRTAKAHSPWLIAGGITVFIGLAATAHILAGFADKADTLRYTHETESTPAPAPIPVMAPVVTSIPIPVATPEVRRAEPVPTPTFRLAHMPDGSSLAVRILGAFTRQEELPLTGNVVGDVYYVGRFPFVWTQLNNGTGAWIDPQIQP